MMLDDLKWKVGKTWTVVRSIWKGDGDWVWMGRMDAAIIMRNVDDEEKMRLHMGVPRFDSEEKVPWGVQALTAFYHLFFDMDERLIGLLHEWWDGQREEYEEYKKEQARKGLKVVK